MRYFLLKAWVYSTQLISQLQAGLHSLYGPSLYTETETETETEAETEINKQNYKQKRDIDTTK